MYRLALLDRRGLPLELGRVIAFLDHGPAPLAGPDVVPAAVLEGGEHRGWGSELEDSSVLGLDGGRRSETPLAHDLAELERRFRFHHDPRHLCGPRPVD